MLACVSFCKLSVTIRLHTTNLRMVVPGSRRIFHKISKGAFTMSLQGFCKKQPSLRLRENTGIFFGSLIIDNGKSAVKGVVINRAPYFVFNCLYTFSSILSDCSADARPLITAQLCGLSQRFASGSFAAPICLPSSVYPRIKRS